MGLAKPTLIAWMAIGVGCHRVTPPEPRPDVSTVPVSNRVYPTEGCGKSVADVSPHAVFLQAGGLNRSYYLALPPNYETTKPHAVVLGFHGSGSDGKTFRDYLGMERSTNGATIFAYPDGLEVSDGGTGWQLRRDGRDVALVYTMLAQLEGTYCIDRSRIFAVGFSYGGWMVNALACDHPGLLTGFASVGGGGPMTECSAPVPAIIIHGAGDFNEPIGSGEDSRDRWRRANSCSKGVATSSISPCVSYQGCSSPLYWCRHEAGHEIPTFAHDKLWPLLDILR